MQNAVEPLQLPPASPQAGFQPGPPPDPQPPLLGAAPGPAPAPSAGGGEGWAVARAALGSAAVLLAALAAAVAWVTWDRVRPDAAPFAVSADVAAAFASIGSAALVAQTFIYLGLCRRLRRTGPVRDALRALAGGETAPAALAVNPELGPEAAAWNGLLAENEALRKRSAGDKARESLGSRREARGELDAAFDAMSQGLVLVGERMQARYCNGAAAVFLGAKRDEILGHDVTRFVNDQAVTDAIQSIATGAARRRTTIEAKRTDPAGAPCGVLRFSIRPVRREDSAAAMMIIEDVTQQRVADEARNLFVTQATHELRTPLTNIRLYVETAIEEGENDPSVRARCLNVINTETRRLEGIVGEMLSVAEIEAGSFKIHRDDVRIDSLLADLEADFAAQAAKGQIELRFNLPPKLPVLRGDREKIALALHNLLGNALKYTPAQGKVTVNVEADAKQVAVEVADTGIGIGEEDARHIFEKFYRAKDARVGRITGTGLGLTLAREVVRLHGGEITVSSQLDKGSTFTMTVPLTGEAA